MLRNLQREHPIESLAQVVDGMRLPELSRQIWDVHVDDSLADYIARLVRATRQHPDLMLGASPRGSLALFKGAQALAAIRGRDYVKPDDVKELARPALAHRLIIKPESGLRGRNSGDVLEEVLQSTGIELGETQAAG
jgi:MoxR-like ATPase